MKKSLVVLLIVVLAVGSAFAAISGKFEGKYVIDFDKKEAGYTPGDKSAFAFTIVADTKETANEGGVYAKIAAEAEFGSYTSVGSWVAGNELFWITDSGKHEEVSFGLTEASINAENWSLDLMNTLNSANYAADVIDTKSWDDKTKPAAAGARVSAAYGYSQALAAKPWTIAGTTFTYKGYKLSTGFNYDNINDAAKVRKQAIVSFETADLAFNDITAKAFAGYSRVKSDNLFAGSVKAAYSDVATVAADFGYKADKFDADVALNVKYAPVTVDAYYATKATAKAKYADGTDTAVDTIENLLSVKAVADLNEYVPAKLTVTAKNLLNKTSLGVAVETKAIEATTLTVSGDDLLNTIKLGAKAEYTGIEATTLTGSAYYTIGKKALDVDASVKYVADLYTATGSVAFDSDFAASTNKLVLKAGVSSTALVSGATLSLDYASGDLFVKGIGKLTTKCVIAF